MIGRDLKTLFCTHTKPNYMPPPKYGPNMLVYGPHYPIFKRLNQGVMFSSKCASHETYDLAELVDRLPDGSKPELVICRVDAYFENHPVNLRGISVPKIAIVGDSHHMLKPITRMLQYLLREKFDYYIVDHNPQHAHWYLEAGIRPVVFVPALLLADEFCAPQSNTESLISFVGTVGPIHPMRSELIASIEASDLPFERHVVPQKEAYEIYNRSRIALNFSLNGDLNLRFFEVMAAGGFLLTDRLSSLASIDSILKEDTHYVAFGSFDELQEKASYYLKNEDARNKIAEAGHRAVKEKFSLERRSEYLSALIENAQVSREFLPKDGRTRAYGCRSRDDLLFRVGFYEWLQEQHRVTPQIRFLSTAGADPRVALDAVDLPRVGVHQLESADSLELARRAGLEQEICFVSADTASGRSPWDVVVCRSDELVEVLGRYAPSALFISNYLELGDAEKSVFFTLMSGSGFQNHASIRGLIYRPDAWSGGIF